MIINFPFLIQVGAQINHVIETGKAHSQGNHSYPVNIWYHEVKLTIPFHSKNMGGGGLRYFHLYFAFHAAYLDEESIRGK